MSCGTEESLVDSRVTLPGFAVRLLYLYASCPVGSAGLSTTFWALALPVPPPVEAEPPPAAAGGLPTALAT